MKNLNQALDEVERCPDVDALVTVGSGKFFTNGLDLESVLKMEREGVVVFMQNFTKLISRFLTFPMVTLAAINGKHARPHQYFTIFPIILCVHAFFYKQFQLELST